MNGIVTESLAELLGLLFSILAAGVLTTVGALTESAGIANLLAGHSTMGLWELWMGAIALYAGIYMLGYQRVVRQLVRSAPN